MIVFQTQARSASLHGARQLYLGAVHGPNFALARDLIAEYQAQRAGRK